MLDRPLWTFLARRGLTQWYGHVHLTPERVIGQWFALDRSTGRGLWEQSFFRPNSIAAVQSGIILATETRSDGPWTLGFGCYAIDELTGDLRWQWHGPGFWGKLVHALDRIPGFTNELRPSFVAIKDGECIVSSGQVLDLQTGSPLRKEANPRSWKSPEAKYPHTPAERLYANKTVEISPQQHLSSKTSTDGQASGLFTPIALHLEDATGATIWQWGPGMLSLHLENNFYGWRLDGDCLFFLCSEECAYRPDPKRPKGNYVISNPAFYHLIVLDVATGEIRQRIPVTERKAKTCRIEAVDALGVLISVDGKELSYFARPSSGPPSIQKIPPTE